MVNEIDATLNEEGVGVVNETDATLNEEGVGVVNETDANLNETGVGMVNETDAPLNEHEHRDYFDDFFDNESSYDILQDDIGKDDVEVEMGNFVDHVGGMQHDVLENEMEDYYSNTDESDMEEKVAYLKKLKAERLIHVYAQKRCTLSSFS